MNEYSDERIDVRLAAESPMPGAASGPIVAPFPTPIPIPFPPDWFRCLRLGPVSGRYEGEMTGPSAGRFVLDLRIDIDPRYANSPVMNRISGDFYDVYRFSLPGFPTFSWRVFRESWIVDAPTVTWSRCQVEITGTVRYWQGSHPATTITVRIPWGTLSPAGPAEVALVQTGAANQTYTCARKSDCFRNINLEVDVVQSASASLIVPSYDTHAHPTRPPDLPQRVLTIEEAYREAGLCLTIRADRTILDDSAPEFSTWSPAELHDSMETHFSQMGGIWPRWEMWGLLAGSFDNAGVGGIMFDAAAVYGGAGEPPERQGFAVFRNHSWFADLPTGTPANNVQAEALRKFLYTWVHEAGHAFNFLHSWNKNRPDALSWMNYDWRYDNRNGPNSFWSNFRLRFDDEELIHLRHGDRASVIMGGDPWASGGHIEAPAGAEYLEAPPGAMAQIEGSAPIEVLVRSKEYFDFLEPVEVEIRVRNLLQELPIMAETQLDPSYGGVIIYIKRPDGRVVEYDPIMCKLAEPRLQVLKPASGVRGEDRYSEKIFLSYGKYGFYFDEPGTYLIRALYQGPGHVLIPSNMHRVRVGYPPSRDADRLAQDFFTYQVGMSLYLGGSASPFLDKGMNVLRDLAERFQDTPVGAKAAITVATSTAEPFFRLGEGDQRYRLIKAKSAEPAAAIALTERALNMYQNDESKALNLDYHNLVRSRADWFVAQGDVGKAKQEVTTCANDLGKRGVNAPVLQEIQEFAESLSESGPRRRARKS